MDGRGDRRNNPFPQLKELRWRLLWLGVGWAWAAAIVWASLTPSPPEVDFEASDKLGHLLSYALLMFWFCRLYASRNARLAHGLAFVAMGVALELVQGTTDTRSLELADMLANALGVAAGWGVARLAAYR